MNPVISLLCFAAVVTADLRMGSQPKNGYRLRQYGRSSERFVAETTTDAGTGRTAEKQEKVLYMEPSTFGYKGLKNQKRTNYDNFLRSNIDNEQDRRNFNDEDGKDHLPFRTLEAVVDTEYTENNQNVDLPITVYPGESKLIPLRWNNPHASELEVNIWLMGYDVVVPIKRPTCSGEGEQNNVVEFTVPKDFRGTWMNRVKNGSKTFSGCNEATDCVIQFYAHSVESRVYTTAVPIIIPDPNGTEYVVNEAQIQASESVQNNQPRDPDHNMVTNFTGPQLYAASTREGLASKYIVKANEVFEVTSNRVFFHVFPASSVQRVQFSLAGGNKDHEKTENRYPFEFTVQNGGMNSADIGTQATITAKVEFDDGSEPVTLTRTVKYSSGANRRLLQVGPDAPPADPDQDPWLDLNKLPRDTCLSASDPYADIPTSQPKKARLVSDVYNHAYQNSNYSPYSGQQHSEISRNMQAACIIHMISGNRGELGKNLLPASLKTLQKNVNKKVNNVYKNYERVANQIIKDIGNEMKTGAEQKTGAQPLASCFRCLEKGSTSNKRLQTTTYIPSFKIDDPTLLAKAKQRTEGTNQESLISSNNVVQIYAATFYELQSLFADVAKEGLIYQPAMVKKTMETMEDEKKFKKRDANDEKDGGVYAATQAKYAFAKKLGINGDQECKKECFHCGTNGTMPSILKGSEGTCTDICNDGKCQKQSDSGINCNKCRLLYTNDPASEEEVATPDPEILEFLLKELETEASVVDDDESDTCMDESSCDNDACKHEKPSKPIPGKCQDSACDKDYDPVELCKCSDEEQLAEKPAGCQASTASSLQSLSLLLSSAVVISLC